MAKKISREISVGAEKTATRKSPLWPRPLAPLVPLDPLAFVAALIGGPVLVTFCLCWLFFVPVVALVLGGPLYLLLGTPLLAIYLGRANATSTGVSLLALVASTLACLSVWALSPLLDSAGRDGLGSIALFFAAFGAIFAPLWGKVTGWIYFRLRRPFIL